MTTKAQFFTFFSECFVITSVTYFIVIGLAFYYNALKLNIKKQISQCFALISLLAFILVYNDDNLFFQHVNVDFCIFNGYYFLLFCFILIALTVTNYKLTNHKLTNSEYLLLLLLSVLGLVLLCSKNDLLTFYLSIELICLALYLLTVFRKNSLYSIEAGLKYFIVGSVSLAFFLLGAGVIYACSGSVYFVDLCNIFGEKPSLYTPCYFYQYHLKSYSSYLVELLNDSINYYEAIKNNSIEWEENIIRLLKIENFMTLNNCDCETRMPAYQTTNYAEILQNNSREFFDIPKEIKSAKVASMHINCVKAYRNSTNMSKREILEGIAVCKKLSIEAEIQFNNNQGVIQCFYMELIEKSLGPLSNAQIKVWRNHYGEKWYVQVSDELLGLTRANFNPYILIEGFFAGSLGRKTCYHWEAYAIGNYLQDLIHLRAKFNNFPFWDTTPLKYTELLLSEYARWQNLPDSSKTVIIQQLIHDIDSFQMTNFEKNEFLRKCNHIVQHYSGERWKNATALLILHLDAQILKEIE